MALNWRTPLQLFSLGRSGLVERNDDLPRDWMDREQDEGHEFLHEATQVKNIWVPTGE